MSTFAAAAAAAVALTLALPLALTSCSDSQGEKFCGQLQQVSNPQTSVSARQTLLELRQLQPDAPLEVRQAMATMIDIFDQFVNTQDPDLARRNLVARSDEMDNSAASLNQYAQNNCGFSLDRILRLPGV